MFRPIQAVKVAFKNFSAVRTRLRAQPAVRVSFRIKR